MEHIREYINDLQDEIQWSQSFNKTQQKLIAAAQRAKQEIAEGQATELDCDRLWLRGGVSPPGAGEKAGEGEISYN